MSKKAILLLNVGTPDAPEVSKVRKYLSQFLNDKRVIDLPWLARKILVNLIIVPFRAPRSTKLYKQLWTENGSPLLYYGENLRKKVQKKLPEGEKVFLAMRYGNPGLQPVLRQIYSEGFETLVVMPLFPQYASSTTQTAIDEVHKQAKKTDLTIPIEFVQQFYNKKVFIEAFAEKVNRFDVSWFDHIVFTYHGLPHSHITKIHPHQPCETCVCNKQMPDFGRSCYKATCYETTRMLAHKLQLKEKDYSVSFQSRLSKNWLGPFTDETLISLAKQGKKNVLIVAPSFVADCLETTIELGVEYKELFAEHGGSLTLVESLNDSDIWVDGVIALTR